MKNEQKEFVEIYRNEIFPKLKVFEVERKIIHKKIIKMEIFRNFFGLFFIVIFIIFFNNKIVATLSMAAFIYVYIFMVNEECDENGFLNKLKSVLLKLKIFSDLNWSNGKSSEGKILDDIYRSP